MNDRLAAFDPVKFKQTTRSQWETAAEAWNRWGSFIGGWLKPATDRMLDLAQIRPGSHVVDVAAGAGEQTLAAARRVGPSGRVLATDISPGILRYAREAADAAGLNNVETLELDGEQHDTLDAASFDAAISRVGLIYFPDQQRALQGLHRCLKPGGRVSVVVYSTPQKNEFFSIPVSIIRRRAQLPAPFPGQPGPFSLGADGVLARALESAGFSDARIEAVDCPLMLSSAAECVRFERESFGALHQMLSSLSEEDRAWTWKEIEIELRRFEHRDRFIGPCEMLVGVATK
ncbi:MAG: class I SAM-dependent methyltransferase [Burkholderiaceae bacterium]